MYCLTKNFGICLLFTAIFLLANQTFAQLSRAEKKGLKKELRKLTTKSLKSILEENQNLSSKADMLMEENKQLKSINLKQAQEKEFLENQLNEVSGDPTDKGKKSGLNKELEEGWESGVVFKVQIGAISSNFKKKQLGENHNFNIDENIGVLQFVIGNFRDYEEANLLKIQMRQAGIRKAWIVPYKNGKRVLLKEVLEEVTGN